MSPAEALLVTLVGAAVVFGAAFLAVVASDRREARERRRREAETRRIVREELDR